MTQSFDKLDMLNCDLIMNEISITGDFSYVIIPKTHYTQEFGREVLEKCPVPGHMPGALRLEVPEAHLYKLHIKARHRKLGIR